MNTFAASKAGTEEWSQQKKKNQQKTTLPRYSISCLQQAQYSRSWIISSDTKVNELNFLPL